MKWTDFGHGELRSGSYRACKLEDYCYAAYGDTLLLTCNTLQAAKDACEAHAIDNARKATEHLEKLMLEGKGVWCPKVLDARDTPQIQRLLDLAAAGKLCVKSS